MTSFEFCIQELDGNLDVFSKLLEQVNGDLILWKPEKNKWNLLEIVCHLADEENEDFRYRLRSVLETPEAPFPAINPTGWVAERSYGSRNFREALQHFETERLRSVNWLNTLVNPNWENIHIHPAIGPMSAKFILTNWIAHDYLHIRQITKLKYDYLAALSGEKLNYAGEW